MEGSGMIENKTLLATGLRAEFVAKELALCDLLADLSQMPFDYSLYGGTAVNKVYSNQRCFSEDANLLVYGANAKKNRFIP